MISNLINFLTISRILLGVVIFLLITRTDFYWLAFILFFIGGLTDYFDGYLARKYNLVSEIGEILDPIADKILIVFLILAISVSLNSFYIAFFGAFIITREIWVGALRDYNARNLKSEATKVTFLAKIKTTIQLFTISVYLLGLSLNNMLILSIGDIFLLIAFLVTIYTGFQYTFSSFKD